jgi:hypothetical protein
MNAQSVIEMESNYIGLTQDERTAIRHVFDNEEDVLLDPEQFSDVLLPKGTIK